MMVNAMRCAAMPAMRRGEVSVLSSALAVGDARGEEERRETSRDEDKKSMATRIQSRRRVESGRTGLMDGRIGGVAIEAEHRCGTKVPVGCEQALAKAGGLAGLGWAGWLDRAVAFPGVLRARKLVLR